MPTVAITDYSFPDLEVEQAILSAAGFEIRSGNDKQTLREAAAHIALRALRGEPLPNVVNGVAQ